MLAGLISAYPQPALINSSVDVGSAGGAPVGRPPKFANGDGIGIGLYAGYFSKIARIAGSSDSRAFSFALICSASSGVGCTGAGIAARLNIINTGTGVFASAGVTSTIEIFTLIAG